MPSIFEWDAIVNSLPSLTYENGSTAITETTTFDPPLISQNERRKIYLLIIATSLVLLFIFICVIPLLQCLYSCIEMNTTIIMAFIDLLRCRDPRYRFIVLAAKRSGLRPPNVEEYDRLMKGVDEHVFG